MFSKWYMFNKLFLYSANDFDIQQEMYIFSNLEFVFSNMRLIFYDLRFVFNKIYQTIIIFI